MAISDEGKIGIGLTLLFGAGTGAVLIAPQQQTWIGGALIAISVVGFVLLAIHHIRTRAPKPKAETVNLEAYDYGFNAALVAASASVVATIRSYPRIAVIAAILAWAGIAVDYWTGPARGFVWSGWFQDPISWFPPSARSNDPLDKQSRYNAIDVIGTNRGSEAITLDDAYVISNVTGEKIHFKVQVAGKPVAINDINAIPPGASIILNADVKSGTGMTSDEFLNSWGRFVFVTSYAGKEHKVEYNKEQATQMVTPNTIFASWPRVTAKH
jgi:hypothetical protein